MLKFVSDPNLTPSFWAKVNAIFVIIIITNTISRTKYTTHLLREGKKFTLSTLGINFGNSEERGGGEVATLRPL